jgi:imidazolonepropionase-like amidohydrolase
MKIITLPHRAEIKCQGYWDGYSSFVTNDKSVFTEDGIIVAAKKTTAADSQCFDYRNCFLLPALIDCHIHLRMPAGKTSPAERIKKYLASGIFAARDAGHRDGFLPVPYYPFRLLQPGYAIFKRGNYGAAIGIGAGSLKEALQTVDMLAEKRASHIKVVASGIFSFSRYGETGPAFFSAFELKQIVRRAGSHNLPVMIHASGDEAVHRALQAGVATIEHGYFMSGETLSALADCGTYWVPTLIPAAVRLTDKKLRLEHTPEERSVISRTLAQHMELVAKGAALGARIACGTDAGAPGVEHGKSLYREIKLLQEAGLSPLQALRAATSTAAAACGLKNTGSIETGRKSCLLAVPGNPLENIDVLQKPTALFLPG